MGKVNYYRLAPTWLCKASGEKKLFMTQAEVDKAWDEGWYGPPWSSPEEENPLLSTFEWPSKQALKDAAAVDSRYGGFEVNLKDNVETIMSKLAAFEESMGKGE